MGINFRFNIGHATVAYFYVVLVEDFVKFMLSWKVLLDEVQENSSDVGEGVVVERRVEPDDVFELFLNKVANNLELQTRDPDDYL